MTRRWPDTLPGAERPGYELQPIDPSIRTDMEAGARRLRRITRAQRDSIAVSWRFIDEQMAAFRAWYGDDLWSLSGDSDDVAGWSAVNVLPLRDGRLGPAGQLADKLRAVAVNGAHFIGRDLTAAQIDNTVLVARATLRAGGHDFARLALLDRAGALRSLDVDLAGGSIVGQSGLSDARIESRAGGWWRVSLWAATGAGGAVPQLRIAPRLTPGGSDYTGNGVDGVHVCEMQARIATGHDLYLPASETGHALGAAGGSAWFFAPLAFGGGFAVAECRFEGGWKASIGQGLRWTVTGNLEVRNA